MSLHTETSWDWDLRQNKIWWSPECFRVMGVDEFDGTYEGFERLVYPDDREIITQRLRSAIDGHSLFEVEFRVLRPDGDVRWVRSVGAVEYDPEQKAVRVYGHVNDITEMQTTASLLRASEEKFRALVETSTLFTWQIDAGGVRPEVFDWFSDLSGQPVRTVDDILSLIHPDDVEPTIKAWRQASAERAVFTAVCRFRCREDYRFLAARGVQVFNDDGSFRQWIGTFNDITERMLAEEEVRKRDVLYRAVLNSLSAAIAVLDADGRVQVVNRNWLYIAGVEAHSRHKHHFDVELGADYPEFCRECTLDFGASAEHVANGIRRVLSRTDTTFSAEYTFESDHGSSWFGMVVTPLQTPEGGAVVSHVDITDQKVVQEAYRKNQEQLELVADTVPTAIAYFDTDARFLFANEACHKWFGKPKGGLVGRTLREVIGDEHYALIEGEIAPVLQGEVVKRERQAFIDPEKYININYTPDRDKRGQISGFFLFIVDLTESRQAEERWRKSEEQLRQAQKLESIGRLAGGIAHDFNNMLTAINGYSEMALLKMSPDDPLRRNIEEIKKAGERSATLTQQLLAFSRRQIIQVSNIDVNQVVEDSLVMLERLIGEDITIVTRLSDDLWNIRGDKNQMSQVLLNLAVNSRDAMPRGGTITISTQNTRIDRSFVARRPGSREGAYVCLSVADTGFGMDEETQKHIFEPFFTTKETGKGTGLGLSTVYGIVKQLNGYVWVTSETNGGTTFDVFFPRAGAVEEVDDEKNLGDLRSGSETILLVEDEDIVRNLSRQVLESCGYNVIEASSGARAVEIYDRVGASIDLLLTDIVMPEMNGEELAKNLAARQADLKVLFVSGYLENPVPILHGVKHGADFIQKPFTYFDLAQKVRDVLDRD